MTTSRTTFAVAAGLVFSLALPAPCASLPARESQIIGRMQQYQVRSGESLIEIARRFDLGFNAIADANPGVDPFIPKPGSELTIPTAWITPSVPVRPAIVINLPELRLYFFPPKGTVRTFPIGIGDEGTDTPVGSYRIIEKMTRPSWTVPKSVRAERPRLPKVVPPGPDNPMGSHALRLSLTSILIHGTNKPWGIGRRSSHGCLRLYPEDITQLYRLAPKGIRVLIVKQPLKVAVRGDEVFLEVHQYDGRGPGMGDAMHLLADRRLLGSADFSKLVRAIAEKRGHPVDVTLRAPVSINARADAGAKEERAVMTGLCVEGLPYLREQKGRGDRFGKDLCRFGHNLFFPDDFVGVTAGE